MPHHPGATPGLCSGPHHLPSDLLVSPLQVPQDEYLRHRTLPKHPGLHPQDVRISLLQPHDFPLSMGDQISCRQGVSF